MASGSQNMTTYNARTVTGSSSAASPAGALLLSGADRASDATGDTWIFLDSLGGTSTPWGIKHDQANNKIHIYGSNTDSVWTRMNTGDTYILGKVGIGYDPETSGNTYKLYVNGSSFFNDHIYLVADKEFYMQYDNTMYDVLHNHNNGNISVNAAGAGLYMAYYNTTFVNWMNGRMELRDGCLSLFPNNNAYRDGMRIHMFNSWSTITLCGADNTGNSGTSANSWFIGNNDGNFYIARNGSPGSTAYIGCVSNVWKFVTAADIPEGAANLSATASVHTLSIYRNGITIPYQMDNVNDGGMLRVRGTAESNCILELGTWDDSGAGETIQFNYYPTTSQITPTYSVSVPKHSGTLVTTDGHGASGTWSINITGSAGSVAWANTGHPSTFPPSAHTHTWLELAPGNKAASTGAAQSDDTGPFTVRWYSQTGRIAQQPTQYGFLITCAAGKGSAEQHALWLEQCDGHIYHRGTNGGNNTAPPAFKKLWQSGDAVTNAVWNDLGESRKSITREPGYAIAPSGSRTSTRLESGARIISDTWGFLLGDENDTEKAPVAIAGRVLAYPLHDKSYYEVGDAVCAAEGGKIDKMTREEIKEYPDRIIGIVNEIPDYDIWEPSLTGGARTGSYKRSYLDRRQISGYAASQLKEVA